MKNKIILWTLLLTFPAITSFVEKKKQGNEPSTRWVISQNSSLSVSGSTNINKFSCAIPSYDHVDTLTLSENNNDGLVMLSGMIGLNINSFDCHNSGMTKQLQKTLNEKQFPVLHIRFLSLSSLPEITRKPEPVTGLVDIEIAGVNKRFEINYRISRDEENVIHLIGSRDLNFSDFKLIPPRKLGGMIQTKDLLTVEFHLKMKTI